MTERLCKKGSVSCYGFSTAPTYDSQQACSWGCPWPAPKPGTSQGAALKQNISMNVNREEKKICLNYLTVYQLCLQQPGLDVLLSGMLYCTRM